MAYSVNPKIRSLKPYDPIQGSYRIRLDANESFLLPPSGIAAKLNAAAASVPFNRYPDPFASQLCAAFADYYGLDPADAVAGNGSDELISLLEEAFLMKDESIMTLSPDFSMYCFYSGICETVCREFRKNDDFTVDVDGLIDAARRNRARMILFSNPCNPTSLGIRREEVRRLIRSVDALVILDEAYMDFWDQSLLGEVNDYENLVILRTCSKAVGMAAIRLGFAVANPALIRLLKAVKSPYNVNSVTQKIGAAILREKDWLRSCTREIIASRESLLHNMKQFEASCPERMQVADGVTNFVTVRLPDAEKIYRDLLKQGIAVRCFGSFLRVTAGTKEENAEFLRAFQASLK